MRRAGIVAGITALLLFATAFPALANTHAVEERTYSDGLGHSATIHLSVNQHDALKWLQGLEQDWDGNYRCAWIDYLKLYKDGVPIETLQGVPGCEYGGVDGSIAEEQTDWHHTCVPGSHYFALVRIKFRWTNDPTSSTWKTLSTDDYVPGTAACAV
jgi:hypothetical protein